MIMFSFPPEAFKSHLGQFKVLFKSILFKEKTYFCPYLWTKSELILIVMYLGVSCGQVTVSWAVPLLFKVKMLVEHVSLPTVIKTLTELSITSTQVSFPNKPGRGQ